MPSAKFVNQRNPKNRASEGGIEKQRGIEGLLDKALLRERLHLQCLLRSPESNTHCEIHQLFANMKSESKVTENGMIFHEPEAEIAFLEPGEAQHFTSA